MFLAIVNDMNKEKSFDKFVYYLERHIELDGGDHGPLALELICNLCGDKVQIVRELSTISKWFCRECDDYFELETVSWSTHSFTIYGEELVRDVQLKECEKHYQSQDELFI